MGGSPRRDGLREAEKADNQSFMKGKDIPKIRNMRGITQEMMEVRKDRWIRSGEDCRDGRSWMWSMEGGPKEFWGLFMNLSSLPASIIIKLIQ